MSEEPKTKASAFVVCTNHIREDVCMLRPSSVTGLFAAILPFLRNCLCGPRSLQSNEHRAVEFPEEVSLSEAPTSASFAIALCDSTQQA